jgi:transposase
MQAFYLGVDVSKGYADFVILNSKKKQVLNSFQLDDTFDGHQRLYGILSCFLQKYPEATLFAGLESTGGYENNWYHSLIEFQASLNIQTARLNPLGVTHNSKADLKRNSTDKISAKNVAEYLIAHSEKVVYQQQDNLAGLRKQWGFIQMLTKQCTQFLNQLNILLYTSNPELLNHCKNEVPKWLLTLLLDYPSAAKLKRARVKRLVKIPYVTTEKAQQLIADAKQSVAAEPDAVTIRLVSETARQIIHLQKNIAVQTRLMVESCPMAEVKLLKTFPGIGDYSAVGLLIEIQTVKRFESAKKLASHWGVHPVYKISGDGVGAFRMSKQGRKEPRKILHLVARSATQCNPLIKEIYEKHLAMGKEKMDALGVCMHKIARIVYGMLKNNTAFDPQIDRNNQNQGVVNAKCKPAGDVRRRYQSYDQKAPISRRQFKKRLEQGQSHSAEGTKNGILAPTPVPPILADA